MESQIGFKVIIELDLLYCIELYQKMVGLINVTVEGLLISLRQRHRPGVTYLL